jgi:hypothetical protein
MKESSASANDPAQTCDSSGPIRARRHTFFPMVIANRKTDLSCVAFQAEFT